MYIKEQNQKYRNGKLPIGRELIKQFFWLLFTTSLGLPQLAQAHPLKNPQPVINSVDNALKSKVDLQFFGDFYIPWHVFKRTKSSRQSPELLEGVRPILAGGRHNVLNFEAVATGAFFPGLPYKKYLLKTPLWLPELLPALGVDMVTLGNNHSMDFGSQGLFDTQARFEEVGIQAVGAGENLTEALRPGVLYIKNQRVCVTSLNRTLPEEFWANDDQPGTAYLSFTQSVEWIRSLAEICDAVIPVVHWGSEGARKPKDYQLKLAKLLIEAGAAAVIGHHPHVIQTIDSHQGRPIFYSLGNFVFGTKPVTSQASGIAVGLDFSGAHITDFWVTPLEVDNNKILFRPVVKSEWKDAPTHFTPGLWKLCRKTPSHAVHCDMKKSRFYPEKISG